MSDTTVRDLALDPATGDLLISGADLALTQGQAAIAQAVGIALQFFRGEWFADLGAGVPYYQSVLGKVSDVNTLLGVFRKAILAVEGVKAVTSLSLQLDRVARQLSVTFSAQTDTGLLGPTTTTVGV